MKTTNRFLTIPLTQADLNTAQKIANQYSKMPKKQAKVLENILAVCAVKNYLQVLDIPIDINKSYSFNLVYQLIENVADLYLTEIGHLECRPVKPNQNFCYIPAETWGNRIGYIAVELAPNYSQAKLLGFIDKVTTENLPIEDLNPLDYLLETITEIELAKEETSVVVTLVPVEAMTSIVEVPMIKSKTTLVSETISQMRIKESVINVASWLDGKLDELSDSLSWLLFPLTELATPAFRSQPILQILIDELRNQGVLIPDTEMGNLPNLKIGELALKLYALPWLLKDKEWSLLLILGTSDEQPLPFGLKLTVEDANKILSEQVIDSNNSNQVYLYTQVIGEFNERFIVTISLSNGETLTLPPFTYFS